MSTIKFDFRAIVYREDSWWIAHCLELDIVSEGQTPDEAVRDLFKLCNMQIDAAMKAGDLDSIYRPAPPSVWSMYARAGTRGTAMPKVPRLPRHVDRFDLRKLAMA
jgi:predicted RNase H-like HicB family nuclease